MAALSEADRQIIGRLGVRLGTESVLMPALLKPAAQRLRGRLWVAAQGLDRMPPPPAGRVMLTAEPGVPIGYYEAMGYRALGGKLVRLDMLERFAVEARALARQGPFAPPAKLGALLGGTVADIGAILEALGYRGSTGDSGTVFAAARRPGRKRPAPRRPRDLDSPFAALRRMQPAE